MRQQYSAVITAMKAREQAAENLATAIQMLKAAFLAFETASDEFKNAMDKLSRWERDPFIGGMGNYREASYRQIGALLASIPGLSKCTKHILDVGLAAGAQKTNFVSLIRERHNAGLFKAGIERSE